MVAPEPISLANIFVILNLLTLYPDSNVPGDKLCLRLFPLSLDLFKPTATLLLIRIPGKQRLSIPPGMGKGWRLKRNVVAGGLGISG